MARVVNEMPCVARDSGGGEFIAYQLAHRDTARPGNGAFGIVHADNVYAEDAIKDFAPELYSAMNCADRAAELKERIGVCSCRRDEVLLEVANGSKRMIRGFNLWLLLRTMGAMCPRFADLSSYRGQVTDCTCGTRTLSERRTPTSRIARRPIVCGRAMRSIRDVGPESSLPRGRRAGAQAKGRPKSTTAIGRGASGARCLKCSERRPQT